MHLNVLVQSGGSAFTLYVTACRAGETGRRSHTIRGKERIMLKNVSVWLDPYAAPKEPGVLLRVVVVLMTVAGLAGALFDTVAIRGMSIVAVVVLGVFSLLILVAERRRLLRKHEAHRELLARYCDFVI